MTERGVRPETLAKLKGGMTAEEAQKILESDPEWVAAREREELDRQRRESEWRDAEAPLAEELRAAGFEVDSAWDLVNTATPYPRALPILLKHLERPYPDRVREGIARALAVRDARFGWETLARLYREERTGTDAKDGLAVALAAAAEDDVIDELISLVLDGTHGDSRLFLLRGLKRLPRPQARAALEELTADAELGREARRLLLGGR